MERPISRDEPFWLSWTFRRSGQGIERLMFGSRQGNRSVGLPANSGDRVLGVIMETEGQPLSGLIRAIHDGGGFVVECEPRDRMCVVSSVQIRVTPHAGGTTPGSPPPPSVRIRPAPAPSPR